MLQVAAVDQHARASSPLARLQLQLKVVQREQVAPVVAAFLVLVVYEG